MRTKHRLLWIGALAAVAMALAGCGTPGAPQPPSLNLPDPVGDLAATRAGDQVALTWILPKKNTDKLLLKGELPVRVCRQEGAGHCEPVGAELSFAPGADGAFTDTLSAALGAGPPRPLRYFVELRNRNGRSAGLSNAAVVLAGQAPPPVDKLTVEARKQGVVLHWNSSGESSAAVRLHRKLLTPPPAAKPQQGLLAPPPEPLEQNLLVEAGNGGRALDSTTRFGQSYAYRAQRVARVTVNGAMLELASPLTDPVRVEIQDIFPPEVPAGLAAVAIPGFGSNPAAIDLSWQPVPDTNLAGYLVYRREGNDPWQRISPAEPQLGPAFHDPQVQPGHTYRYAVSAIGQNGHESPRSEETEETVPNP
jgi:predicted small lipoprotein YifL